MTSLFYWTGAVVWVLIALAAALVAGVALWIITVTLARFFSIFRFTLALRRKRKAEPSPFKDWVATAGWIFMKAWNDNGTLELAGHDGSRWNGVGKWSINDKPWPQPESTPQEESHEPV